MMVQRTLAARSLSHAQGGTLFAGYLKIFPVFLLVLPGMISRVLFPGKMTSYNNGMSEISTIFHLIVFINGEHVFAQKILGIPLS